ncbi:MAG: hypothetical protein FJW27_17775 [Acidimicrobiia bacterium]|nr:hypothetical protein [Acidimicrobiia bacterium]
MGKKSRAARERHKAQPLLSTPVKWGLAIVLVAFIGYAISDMSGVAYDGKAIGVVDFSGLTADQRQEALQAANRSRCPCGCNMNTAQCVATDTTGPLREENIGKIRAMVRDARHKS